MSGTDVFELIRDAPKKLHSDYLKQLYPLLCKQSLMINKDIEDISRSLLLFVLDNATSTLDRCLAVIVLQRLPPVQGLIELLSSATAPELINILPVLFVQDFSLKEISDIIKKLCWSLEHDNLSSEEEKVILTFLSRVSHSSYNQDDVRNIVKLLPGWIRSSINLTPSKTSRFQRSSSMISVTEVDGSESKDIFTVLNYAQVTNADQFLNIQVFSMLRSWLLNVSGSTDKTAKSSSASLADLVTDSLSSAIQEYCLRLVDQANKKVHGAGMIEYQKACLVEAVFLLDVICRSDSGKVHIVLPTIKRIYKDVSTSISDSCEAKDVAVLVAALQFFINHGSAVMYKHDDLYPFVFRDLFGSCYQDNFAAFEIISLMKENLAQLCYNSSVLEKYFPTFFEVLAWWPTTFLDDFLQLLPAFMSQHTSLEIFHSLMDLPCLSAVLITKYHKFNLAIENSSLDDSIYQILKSPDYMALAKHMLRKASGSIAMLERNAYRSSVQGWHNMLLPLISQARVISCSESCIPLIKCFFTTFLQYADESVVVMLFPAMLDRLTLLYQVPGYPEKAQRILADSIIQLFNKHPVVVFHCKKIISSHLNHLKNYCIAKECFINLVWVVGEYVSVAYSDLCRPDVVMYYFQQLESTVYEIINSITWMTDDTFLKLINVSVSTLAKLAARSQDLLPHALLCLGKAHQQLASFDNSYKKGWNIVSERILELITILNTPNVASIILSPPKDLESGRLHRDATSLPFVLRAVTALLKVDTATGDTSP